MATFYLDFLNGVSGNAGTSWATAKLNINDITAALVAPGDVVKIAKTPDPWSAGVATWAGDYIKHTVTLSQAYSKLVDNTSTGWVGSANVTVSYISGRNTSVGFTVAAGFTTGKIAYKALAASSDFSAYQQVGFWTTVFNNQIVANTFKVCLCSDTTGDVIVDEFVIPAVATNNNGTSLDWRAMVVNKGSTLGATIQSVAIYAIADPGAILIYLDNIAAYLPSTDAHYLSLRSLVSRGTTCRDAFTIEAVEDAVITVGRAGAAKKMNTSTFYSQCAAANGDVTTYIINPVVLTATTAQQIQDTGSIGSPITYSGGWNTATNEQDGYTWIDFMLSSGLSTFYSTAKNYINIDHFGMVRLATAQVDYARGWNLDHVAILSIDIGLALNYYAGDVKVTNSAIRGGGGGSLLGLVSVYSASTSYRNSCWSNILFEDTDIIGSNSGNIFTLGCAANNVEVNHCTIGGSRYPFLGMVYTGDYYAWGGGLVKCRYCNFVGNTGYISAAALVFQSGSMSFVFDSCTGVPAVSATAGSSTTYYSPYTVLSTKINGVASRFALEFVHPFTPASHYLGRISDVVTAGLDPTWAYGGSGASLVFDSKSNAAPMTLEFAVPVTASAPTSLSFMVRKDAAGDTGILNVTVYDNVDTSAKLVSAQSLTLTSSWAAQSVSFTPSATGFCRVRLEMYMGSSAGGYVGLDSIQVSPSSRFNLGVLETLDDVLALTNGSPVILNALSEKRSISL